jgi:DNA-binding CsgD family transcriptional regulator
MRARACLRIAEGDVEGGLRDLLWLGRRAEGMGAELGMIDWRPVAARAAAALGHAAEARHMAGEELERAQTFGAPRALGSALRATAAASTGQRRVKLLREAVEALEASPSRLERAHALLELGGALREAGSRAQAREPLRAALDLAFRCGARGVERRAREELVAAGARPRRAALTGRDALTPSERRVAEMAASGMANRDIAQALFVTGKTVEVHLSSVYRKLGLRSRAELAGAL